MLRKSIVLLLAVMLVLSIPGLALAQRGARIDWGEEGPGSGGLLYLPSAYENRSPNSSFSNPIHVAGD